MDSDTMVINGEEWVRKASIKAEYAAPCEPTLLEAAEAALKAWRPKGCDINSESVRRCMGCLSAAVEREKKKPVLNCDRYAAEKEAAK